MAHFVAPSFVVERGTGCGNVVFLTLSNGISQRRLAPTLRFSNVDDVTQDPPNPRALRASGLSVFAGATFHLAPIAPPGVSSARFAASGRMGARPFTGTSQAINGFVFSLPGCIAPWCGPGCESLGGAPLRSRGHCQSSATHGQSSMPATGLTCSAHLRFHVWQGNRVSNCLRWVLMRVQRVHAPAGLTLRFASPGLASCRRRPPGSNVTHASPHRTP